jgi:hypothetical protein
MDQYNRRSFPLLSPLISVIINVCSNRHRRIFLANSNCSAVIR